MVFENEIRFQHAGSRNTGRSGSRRWRTWIQLGGNLGDSFDFTMKTLIAKLLGKNILKLYLLVKPIADG